MNTIDICELFNKNNFNYESIKDKLFKINDITKTRVDPNKKTIIN